MSLQLWNLTTLAACSSILFGLLGSCSQKGTGTTAADPSNSSSASSVSDLPDAVAIVGNRNCATATADSDTTKEGISKLINVLANDSGATTIASVTSPTTRGNKVAIEGNQIRFTPKVANGQVPLAPYTDTFTYRINNNCGGTSTATVSVRVTAPGARSSVVITNNSQAEITVFVAGQQIDVVQPRAVTIMPETVAAGTLVVRVLETGARSVTATITFQPEKKYRIIYTDTRLREPTIDVRPL